MALRTGDEPGPAARDRRQFRGRQRRRLGGLLRQPGRPLRATQACGPARGSGASGGLRRADAGGRPGARPPHHAGNPAVLRRLCRTYPVAGGPGRRDRGRLGFDPGASCRCPCSRGAGKLAHGCLSLPGLSRGRTHGPRTRTSRLAGPHAG